MKKIIRLTESDLIKLVKKVVQEQTSPQPTKYELQILPKKIIKLTSGTGEGLWNIIVGKNVKNLQIDGQTPTSNNIKLSEKNNYLFFDVTKLIKGKNEKGVLEVKLNGQTISNVTLNYPDGDPNRQYFMTCRFELPNLPKGVHSINIKVDGTQFNKNLNFEII